MPQDTQGIVLTLRAKLTVTHRRCVGYDWNTGNHTYVPVSETEHYNIVTDAGRVGIHTYIYGTTAQRSGASPVVSNVGLNYIALSNDSGAPAAGDTSLTGEISGNGLTRVQGSVTLPTGSGTVTTISHTFTYTGGGTQSVQKTALFDDPTTGRMAHEIQFTQRTLATNDQLTLTFQITLALELHMANVFVPNGSLAATDNSFTILWKLTRALKSAGATYKASGDGSTKETGGSPDSDLWNGSGGAVVGQTGSAASITTVDRGIATLTGLTGMVSTHVGHYMTITGAASGGNNGAFLIVEYLSSSSVRIRNSSAVASDANNGAITWTQKNPLQETYPTALDSVSAWWHCWGVPTVKVPCNTNSTGTFLRGEKITQATSNAEGELLGFMYDSSTPANSFLVVLPRLGTFDGTNLITGASSSATITPSASPVSYQAEIVIWKANNTNSGTLYYARASTSDTQLFSLVSSAGCTATVAPGGGGTGNSFPTGSALVARGTGGAATHAAWVYTTSPGNAKYQIAVTNMIGLTDQSPDGSFWTMYGMPGIGSTDSHGFAYFRCDNGEPGDVDPFLWYYPSGSRTQTSAVSTYSSGTWSSSTVFYSNTNNILPGWRRRSFPSGDAYQTFEHAYLVYGSAGTTLINTFGTPETVACQTNTVRVAEPLWAITKGVTTKMRKGTLRWLMFVPTGNAYDTWENLGWVQVFTATSSNQGIILGPWDGTTTPTQT